MRHAPSTSLQSKIQLSIPSSQKIQSSISAKWALIQNHSMQLYARHSAKILMSSWSAKCAALKRCLLQLPPPKRDTWFFRLSIQTTPRRLLTELLIHSRQVSKTKFAYSSPHRWQAFFLNVWCRVFQE